MIVVSSTPPSPTYSDIPAGDAFRYQGDDWHKLQSGNAARLSDGVEITIAPTEVVTPAPGATYTMWPPA